MSWWKGLVEGVTGPVKDYLVQRMQLRQARFEAKLKLEIAKGDRMSRLISEGLAADANWEMEFARQAATSNKDEFVLGVVSIPAILCFISLPFLDGPGIVQAGFIALATTPPFYQIILGSMFLHTIGVRWWRRKQSDT